MDLYNEKRRLALEVNKVDKEHHDHFLNGAIFEVYDKTTGEFVTKLCSGNLMITGNDKDEEYLYRQLSMYCDRLKSRGYING